MAASSFFNSANNAGGPSTVASLPQLKTNRVILSNPGTRSRAERAMPKVLRSITSNGAAACRAPYGLTPCYSGRCCQFRETALGGIVSKYRLDGDQNQVRSRYSEVNWPQITLFALLLLRLTGKLRVNDLALGVETLFSLVYQAIDSVRCRWKDMNIQSDTPFIWSACSHI
jgi:hypothetical protein